MKRSACERGRIPCCLSFQFFFLLMACACTLLSVGSTSSPNGYDDWPTYCETAGEISVLLSEDKRTLNVKAEVFCISSPIIAAYLQVATDDGLFKASVDLTSFAVGNTINGSIDPRAFLDELMNGKVYLEVLTLNDVDGKFIGKLDVKQPLVVESTELYSVNLLKQRNAEGFGLPFDLRLNTIDHYLSPILLLEESDSYYLRMAPTDPDVKKKSGTDTTEFDK